MTFANIDGLLILGMGIFTASLWMILKGSPSHAKIKRNNQK